MTFVATFHVVTCSECGQIIGYTPNPIPKNMVDSNHSLKNLPLLCLICTKNLALVSDELNCSSVPHSEEYHIIRYPNSDEHEASIPEGRYYLDAAYERACDWNANVRKFLARWREK